MELRETLLDILGRAGTPPAKDYAALVTEATVVLEHEESGLRPPDEFALPGGLLILKPHVPTIVVPDLHARTDFFMSVMECTMPGGTTLLDSLARGSINIVCLGDGFHAEGRARKRWENASREHAGCFAAHDAMDDEMRESMGLMEMVMRCKTAFPVNFHFLKGNHENVLNEEGDGNHSFRKFVDEGAMVRDYLVRFYGLPFLENYARFEKSLPVAAVGQRFMASHAEPLGFYPSRQVINARKNPETVLGLTWTDNDEAEPESVSLMLMHYLPAVPGARYLGGHRAFKGVYRLRADGKFVQINNPEKFIVAWLMPDRDFNPETDIGEIRSQSVP